MAKRFIDTDLFRKPLVRSLQAPYKVLWVYLLCECDHAGIWDVELDVASMRLGIKLDPAKCAAALGSAVVLIDGGKKWWIPEFIAFQYGKLNLANKVHGSVLAILAKHGIDPNPQAPSKDHASPLQGAKDMDKEKEKDTQGGKEHAPEPAAELPFASEPFATAWGRWEKHRTEKRQALTESTRLAQFAKCQGWGERRAIDAIDHSIASGWTGLFEPKGNGQGAHVNTLKTADPHKVHTGKL